MPGVRAATWPLATSATTERTLVLSGRQQVNALDEDKRPIFADSEIDGERPNDNGAYLHAQGAQTVQWFAHPIGVLFEALHESPEGRHDRFTLAGLSRLPVKPS